MKLDCIPDWVSRWVKLSKRYTLPSMPFALNADKARGLAGTIPGVRAVREVDFPPGRAPWRYRLWKLTDPIGVLRRARHYTALLEFSR